MSNGEPKPGTLRPDADALTDAQRRGMDIFLNKADCAMCHTPPTFTNGRFANAGIGLDKCEPDAGRKKITGHDNHFGRFRIPSLRDIAHTAPYFHDGSVKTLEEAVAIMADGGIDNPHLSVTLRSMRDSGLTEQDKKDLVEFLKALSGQHPVVEPPELPRD